MVLNQVPGIIAEQCRIYRLWTNGRIKAAEMTSGMSGLREIRQSIEALPSEPMVQPPVHFNIVSVPNGYELGSNGGFTPMPITIEHDPQPPTRVDERSMEANCELSNGEPGFRPSLIRLRSRPSKPSCARSVMTG